MWPLSKLANARDCRQPKGGGLACRLALGQRNVPVCSFLHPGKFPTRTVRTRASPRAPSGSGPLTMEQVGGKREYQIERKNRFSSSTPHVTPCPSSRQNDTGHSPHVEANREDEDKSDTNGVVPVTMMELCACGIEKKKDTRLCRERRHLITFPGTSIPFKMTAARCSGTGLSARAWAL